MLRIRGLVKHYGGLSVLDQIDLDVDDHEIVALLGPSGCGKTTILNIIAGMAQPDGGSIDTGGARIGYVFQEDRLLPWLTVEENVGVVGGKPDPAAVGRLLDLVGLNGFARFYPAALSGGMRQRCAIARAYHYQCDLLLMDEPFKSLDHGLRREMLSVLMTVWRERRNAVLFVTHDIDEALALATRIVVLSPLPARVAARHTIPPPSILRSADAASLIRTEILKVISQHTGCQP